MVEQAERLIEGLAPIQVESMGTPIPDFRALHHDPAELGHRAHIRLEQLVGMPVATNDAVPDVGNADTGQRSGQRLGDLVGREREFTRNLPQIQANVKAIAKDKGVPEAEVWDDLTEILSGSGIGEEMHRTLFEPLDGAYGARDYIRKHADSGIVLLFRGAIDNWQTARFDNGITTISSLPESVRSRITDVAFAGSLRPLNGPTELWRPAVQPYVEQGEKGPTSSLTEATVAQGIHAPAMQFFLRSLGVEDATVHALDAVPNQENGKPARGDDVMRAMGRLLDGVIRERLVIEFGNSPAGYMQLAGGLILAKEFGVSPEQLVAIANNRVDIIKPDAFAVLSPEQKSRRQNVATAVNSYNGWQQGISETNQYALETRST